MATFLLKLMMSTLASLKLAISATAIFSSSVGFSAASPGISLNSILLREHELSILVLAVKLCSLRRCTRYDRDRKKCMHYTCYEP